jgi:hypothetical protein
VAVPSRLYSQVTPLRPLAGLRIAVKDLFHLANIKSALNDRSFLETYGPDAATATYIKNLIDLGATIVGKTKMTAFAGGERAPENWIDFHCPFNPRADGYQAPSGSTSGGAACLAGYEWLDLSMGTDSTIIILNTLTVTLKQARTDGRFSVREYPMACSCQWIIRSTMHHGRCRPYGWYLCSSSVRFLPFLSNQL